MVIILLLLLVTLLLIWNGINVFRNNRPLSFLLLGLGGLTGLLVLGGFYGFIGG